MNPNFNSGFLQEAFRLNQQNFQAPGDPNYFTDQQIRQNQAVLGQIQNTGAFQQNQLQQIQILRQMQQIQDEAQEQRIKNTLYPDKDSQGNSFFATLRQHAALEQMRQIAERRDAADTVRIQQKTTALESLRRQDAFRAEDEGIPKIADFRDNVLAPLQVRIMQGGADGRLALKELETLQPDRSLSQYTDVFGQVRESPELRANIEKMVGVAREQARGTSLGKLRDAAIKDLTETQIAADELMSFREYMPAEKFNEAVALRAEIQKFTLESDYANPDPVAIANLSMRVNEFNLGQLQKLREAREGARVAQEANPNLGVTEVTSGPKGVEVKAEKEKLTAMPGAAETRQTREKQVVEIENEITQNEADIKMLEQRKKEGRSGADLQTKNKDGTPTGVTIEDLLQRNKVLEQKLNDLKTTYGMPKTARDQQVDQAMSGRGPASVPNVIQSAPQGTGAPAAPSTGTRINAPSAYQPAVPVPGGTNPVAVLRFVKQNDGKIVGTFTTPPSTSTNNTAKPK